MRRIPLVPLLALTGGLSFGLLSEPAQACGGLFCSAANPVDQSAERIVFARNGDGTITSIIEIQYEGPSEKFAWLLPLPGSPKVEVSTVEALDAIDSATRPVFNLQYTFGEQCQVYPEAETADFATPSPNAGGDPSIDVLAQGTAGPYDFVTIRAKADVEDPAAEAIAWLEDNDYDVGATGPDVLRPYLAEGLSLVAFKLTKGQDAGAIRPVKLTYEATTPSIPIRPTAVAAKDDMGVRVFLLDEARSVSDNYLSVELNEARINWFNWQPTYDAIISEAADEANGNAFVTEFAGTTDALEDRIWSDSLNESWVALQAFDGTGAETLWEARFPFRSYQGFRRAAEAATVLPAGVTFDEFAADPLGVQEQHGDVTNRSLFLQELEKEVVEPLRGMQELVAAHPYLSRLYTTLSPDEMELDPSFVVNKDLPEVSNVHEAKIEFLCTDEYPGAFSAPWVITLKDGSQIEGIGQGVWLDAASTLPAALSISQLSGSGAGQTLEDNSEAVADQLEAMQTGMSVEPVEGDDDGAADDDATGDDATGDDDAADDDAADDDAADDDAAEVPVGADDDAAGVPVGATDNPAGASDAANNDDDGCSVAAPGKNALPESAWALLGLGLVAAGRRRKR